MGGGGGGEEKGVRGVPRLLSFRIAPEICKQYRQEKMNIRHLNVSAG